MPITFNRKINNIEHNWYDSSNIVYTACYDNAETTKSLKIVFKGGRTYLYREVDVNDYLLFTRDLESVGSAFNKYIKKYPCVRQTDTDLDKLNAFKEEISSEKQLITESTSNLDYVMQINGETGQFRLILNGRTIFEGIENQVSIVNLFHSMAIAYRMEELTYPFYTEQDFVETDGIFKPQE